VVRFAKLKNSKIISRRSDSNLFTERSILHRYLRVLQKWHRSVDVKHFRDNVTLKYIHISITEIYIFCPTVRVKYFTENKYTPSSKIITGMPQTVVTS
jgi:hypothetical protein